MTVKEKERVIRNIFNFATVYRKNGTHNQVWLEAQISNQLEHFREYIEITQRQQLLERVEKEVIGEDDRRSSKYSAQDYANYACNELRKEQRTKLDQLRKEQE